MTFTLRIEPPRCTAQHKGERIVGRFVQHYEKRPQRMARLAYLAAIREAMASGQYVRDYSRMDADGAHLPLRVRIEFVFRAARRRDEGRAKVTRPDLDNMAKGLLDCLQQAELICDDAQITDLSLRKTYSAQPRVVVTVANDARPRAAHSPHPHVGTLGRFMPRIIPRLPLARARRIC